MRKLSDLKLKGWFEAKQSTAFIAASVNPKYFYEIQTETEKAIQICIKKENEIIPKGEWKMWLPKSVILNPEEVL